jgi:Holliday junction resolvase-like predicted endonuclease
MIGVVRPTAAAASRPRTRAQQAGDRAERFVAGELQVAGWSILGRNVRAGRGEIDILAVDPGPPRQLVALEVRWRARRDFGLPEETVDFRKRGRMRTAVGWLLDRGCLPDGTWLPRLPMRIDLVVVEPPVTQGGKLRMRHHRYVG